MKKPILVLTPGDPDGIGPEITWKIIQTGLAEKLGFDLLCVGAEAPFIALGAPINRVSLDFPNQLSVTSGKVVNLLCAPVTSHKKQFLPGYQAGWSIQHAAALVRSGKAKALVTGPISKDRLARGGFAYPGHTEFLAAICGTPSVTMMLANQHLRVSMVTTHLALRNVSKALSPQLIENTILQTATSLQKWWGIQKPKIAVAALNPHGGEAGRFGTEDRDLIAPVVGRLQNRFKKTVVLSGPHPADTLFAKNFLADPQEKFDAIVCMYHDQGLIPVKLLDFGHTVNITLGLPMIRTSVDHGVGFDIAGKGLADPSSMRAAIELAAQLSKQKRTRI